MTAGDVPQQVDSARSAAADESLLRRLQIASSPHLSDRAFTTRRMMREVLFALVPVLIMAVVVFRWYAVVQVGSCVLACLVAEAAFACLARKPLSLGDYSAVLTGTILGLSLPWSSPWYVAVLGSFAAIGLGKAAFGGLGYNIFNPAMVGRAFAMLSFAREMGASAYVVLDSQLTVVTQATPLSLAKQFAADLAAGRVTAGEAQVQLDAAENIWALLVGQANGSLGETSALAILLGGTYLILRGVISWEIPLGIMAIPVILVELSHWLDLTLLGPLQHLITGSILFGAFFIATDPVTSPVTRMGKLLFGMGVGFFIVVIRLFSSYPEGVMFAVLLMNAAVPLLNRWTIPRPLGGPAPVKGK
jgi:Na+-translocating ferredoxin:NAD+ oxidoreductase subunit D